MEFTFARHLDAQADWRQGLEQQAVAFQEALAADGLLDASLSQVLATLRARLAGEQLVVAFVAEFSRGKSELINAIFFADTGRRILPASPGRTTMCPVELGHDAALPPLLALLPIETRGDATPLSELRAQPALWQRMRLDADAPERMAEALQELTRTKAVPLAEARALGLVPHEEDAQEGSGLPTRADGLVEIPAWRHAVVNYPHPLLRRGLIVLDTPGLNAVGAEPELTLSLLPSAHAVVFVLSADTGVTQSELAVWRDHLGGLGAARYVVLNKIDTLADPLLPPDAVQAQIDRQCATVAQTLDVPVSGVFPLSARQALTSRIEPAQADDAAGGLPALEEALVDRLLPRRHEVLAGLVCDGCTTVETQALRRVADQRRQLHEQLQELRDVRGKSAAKVQWTIDRLDAEAQEFERCTSRLAALRSVQGRLVGDVARLLSAERLREEVTRMQSEATGRLLNLHARKAFAALCVRLRMLLHRAADQGAEMQAMLTASYQQLNSEFGFALAPGAAPSQGQALAEIDLIERNYGRYLGLPYALRLGDGRQMDQFRRMLLSKLEVILEQAVGDLQRWSHTATTQVDVQLRDRRRAFQRRRETLERAHGAAGELAQRITELEAQDLHWQAVGEHVQAQAALLRERARHLSAPVDIPLAFADESPPPARMPPVRSEHSQAVAG
ncbi:dynamin family protein [Aquincola sp. MAHUQ-54]|uniref:Dynamin family protein n=1 Tax=Aquincola agrisoli TaxID=3119538 RepID=A0AAW9QHR6_9BURK